MYENYFNLRSLYRVKLCLSFLGYDAVSAGILHDSVQKNDHKQCWLEAL
jgi:hypothetical protein